MSSYVTVGRVETFAEEGCRVIQVGDKPVAVFRTPQGFFAVVDFCSHRGGPLSEGTLKENSITCPWHGSQFDLRNGRPLCGPAVQTLRTYLIEIVDGEVRVFY